MVTINDATVRNNIFETVYDLINTNMSSWVSTVSLYGGYPDEKDISFPSIIIMPIDVDEDSYTIDTTRGSSAKVIAVNIDIFSKSNKDLDILADGLTHMFRTNQMSGLFLENVSENMQFLSPNDIKLKQKVLTFTFKRR